MNYFIFIVCALFSLNAQEGNSLSLNEQARYNLFSGQVDDYFAQRTDEPAPPYTQSVIPERLRPIFFGYALQALIPTIAQNACLTDKISPACQGKVILPTYFTDTGAALIFQRITHKEISKPFHTATRLIAVATPLGAFPCFTQKTKTVKLLSSRIRYTYMKKFFENLLQPNNNASVVGIDSHEHFYASPIVGLPGISNIFDKMGMKDDCFLPQHTQRVAQEPQQEITSLHDEWAEFTKAMPENAQNLIAAAERQLHKSQFQVKNQLKTVFSPRQLSNPENSFVVVNLD